MIRPAKFADVPRIVELLTECHADSRYGGMSTVNEKAAHDLVAPCVQRHGHTNCGGSLVLVAEKDGVVEGFMIGLLDRIYHITNELSANDMYLYVSPRMGVSAAMVQMFKGYLEWATGNPKVAEIHASWTDAFPNSERIALLYERMDFHKCGEIWKRGAR